MPFESLNEAAARAAALDAANKNGNSPGFDPEYHGGPEANRWVVDNLPQFPSPQPTETPTKPVVVFDVNATPNAC